jgi:hypothetical protein
MTIRISLVEDINFDQLCEKYKDKFNNAYVENNFSVGICDNYNTDEFEKKLLEYTKQFSDLIFKIHIYYEDYLTCHTIISDKIIQTTHAKIDTLTKFILEFSPMDIFIKNEITHLIDPNYDYI